MRHDKTALVRRARFVQAMFFQASLVVLLVAFALFSLGNRQGLLLACATLVIPLGWGWLFWDAYRRDEAARAEGRWTKESDAAERKRVYARLAAVFVLWLVLLAVIVVYV